MKIQTVPDGNKITIACTGSFDFHVHRKFRQAYDGLPAGKFTHIRLDLRGVTYLDSSALGMLLMLRDRHPDSAITIVVVPGSVKQVLDIANFGKMFKFE